MLICLTTTDSKEKAEEIANSLLKERLVACISISRVSSLYWWKGKVEKADEFLLIIKTFEKKKEDLAKKIKEIHNYSTPEIVFLKSEAEEPYLSWLNEVLI